MKKNDIVKTIFSKTTAPLLMAFIALASFALGIFIYSSYQGYKNEIKRSTADNRSLAFALEQYTETKFNNADVALMEVDNLISEIDLTAPEAAQKLSKLLSGVKNNFQNIETISVTDEVGNVLARADYIGKDLPLGDRPYFIQQKNTAENNLIISDPLIGRQSGKTVVVLSRKRKLKDGRFTGLIIASIDLERLMSAFIAVGSGDTEASLALINEKRILIARYPLRLNKIGQVVPLHPQIVASLDKGYSEGSFEGTSVVDGKWRIYTFKNLAKYSLMVIVGKSKDKILTSWKNHIISTSIIGILLTIIIASGLYRYFLNLHTIEKQKILLLNSSRMSSLGIMASSVAHEINNPLTIISGKAKQIISLVDQEKIDTERVRKHAMKINEISFRIGKIVQALKLISRDAQGEEQVTVYISKVIEDAINITAEKMKDEGVDLKVDIEKDVFIRCPATQLSQVVLSLLNNSLYGLLHLNEKWIVIKVQRANNEILQISITDSRKGVAKEIKDAMESSLFSTDRNLNLDLSIIKSVIAGFSGTLRTDYKSENTNFIIELPIGMYVYY